MAWLFSKKKKQDNSDAPDYYIPNKKGSQEDPEITAAREKGRREGALERAEKEGKAQGLGEEAKEGSRTKSRAGGYMQAFNESINNTEKMFGFDQVGIGGGLDFGFGGIGGGSKKEEKTQPVTETIVKGNKVIMRQYGGKEGSSKKKGKQASPYGWMKELEENNFLEE